MTAPIKHDRLREITTWVYQLAVSADVVKGEVIARIVRRKVKIPAVHGTGWPWLLQMSSALRMRRRETETE